MYIMLNYTNELGCQIYLVILLNRDTLIYGEDDDICLLII
jgi:hypothetical protein